MPYKNPETKRMQQKIWRSNNPDKVRAISQRSRKKNGHKYREGNIQRLRTWRASLSKEQLRELQLKKWHFLWDTKLGWERGTHERVYNEATVCALCGEPFSDSNDNLRKDTDHCHNSMKFRGIIHHNCNVAVGLFGDDADRCQKAADYLRRAKYVIETQEREKQIEIHS